MEISQNNHPAVMKRLLEKLLYAALKQVQNAPKSSMGSHIGVLNNANSAVYLTIPSVVESLMATGFAQLNVALTVNVSVPNTELSQLPLKVKVEYSLEELVNDALDAKACIAAKEALSDSFSQKVLDKLYIQSVQLLII